MGKISVTIELDTICDVGDTVVFCPTKLEHTRVGIVKDIGYIKGIKEVSYLISAMDYDLEAKQNVVHFYSILEGDLLCCISKEDYNSLVKSEMKYST